MKNIRLVVSAVLLFCLCGTMAFAQSHKYERSGMTVILTDYADQYSRDMNRHFATYRPASRYDHNVVDMKTIRINHGRDHYVEGSRDYTTVDYSFSIQDYLNQENLGLDIIATLFNRQPDGTMDIRLMEERGLYNANDEDFFQSAATKRGVDRLKDFGETLIAYSYVTVLDYQNIRYEHSTKDGDEKGEYYWKGSVQGYLYQIDWTPELLEQVYNCWIDEEDSEAVRAEKNRQFQNIRVRLKNLMASTVNLCIDTDISSDQRAKKKVDATLYKKRAFEELVAEGASKAFDKFEERYSRFQLKVGVYETHPVRAKLGTKEGVERDVTFYVYENIQNEDGTIQQKRIGVIAASDEIANNEGKYGGNTELTRFYRIAGGRIEPGQSMTEKKLYRLAFEVAPAMYCDKYGVRIGLESDGYSARYAQRFFALDFVLLTGSINADVRVGYGLRMNNFQLYPYIGGMLDMLLDKSVLSESDDTNNRAWYGTAGLKMNLNLYFPVWLTVNAGYNLKLSEGVKYAASGYSLNGIYMTAGVRYYF